MIAGMLTTLPANDPTTKIKQDDYVINGSSPTIDQYSSTITGKFIGSKNTTNSKVPSLEDTIITLYDHLREIQEPLGAEFQKVLDDNFSELLARW
jgi:hypothetical protein